MSWAEGIEAETDMRIDKYEIFCSAFLDESIATFSDGSYTAYNNKTTVIDGRSNSLETQGGGRAYDNKTTVIDGRSNGLNTQGGSRKTNL